MWGLCTYASGDTAKIAVLSFMGYLKGKSGLVIFEKWGNVRYQHRNREFWCRGYYGDTVGKGTKKIVDTVSCAYYLFPFRLGRGMFIARRRALYG